MKQNIHKYAPWILVGLYLFTRWFNLTILPVFADEAIYIRWASMIWHDPKQFLFLPLYDGKSPLFIWLLIPWVKLSPYDPLLYARLLSSVFGAISILMTYHLTLLMTKSNKTSLLAAFLMIILPYPLFYDRMGLIDTAVTSWLSLTLYWFYRWRLDRKCQSIVLAGFFWGLSLMTKTTGFYFLPVLLTIWFCDVLKNPKLITVRHFLYLTLAMMMGLIMLGWMRVSPLFPFLFNRSQDFTFSMAEIINNPWSIIWVNGYKIGSWLVNYFTLSAWVVLLSAVLVKRKISRVLKLLLLSIVYILPFWITGKMLASRYLLPLIIFIIPAIAITVSQFKKWLLVSTMIVIVINSFYFAWPLLTDPGKTPFTEDDSRQYLSDWSAGYGIPDVRDYLISRVKTGQRVLVGTEGSFGTLPDGLFIYFSETTYLKSMEIIGVGQPIRELSQELIKKKPRYNETYLVVNKNRLLFDYHNCCQLVREFFKPDQGSPLVLLKVL